MRRTLGPLQLFCLAFGAILGAGWIIAVGQWIAQAGPGGTVLGFVCGAGALSLIALCYAELGALYPATGGEIVYGERLFGRDIAYFTGWVLGVIYVSVCAFSAISIGWLVEVLAPGIQGPVLYRVLEQDIHSGGLAAGLIAIGAVTLVNYIGVQAAARVQGLFTVLLLCAFALFITGALAGGHVSNLQPWFVSDSHRPGWVGVLGVFVTAPFWFSGWAAIAQALGEGQLALGNQRRTLAGVFIAAISAACLFYCCVVLASASSVPRTQLLHLALPAAGALEQALHSAWLARLVLVTGLLSLLLALNAIFYSATRVLFCLGQMKLVSVQFASLDARTGAPTYAGLWVCLLSIVGTGVGRGAIVPLVDAASILIALVYLMVCSGVLKARKLGLTKRDRTTTFVWPALAVTLAVLAIALIEPWRESAGNVPSDFVLLLITAAVGVALRKPERR